LPYTTKLKSVEAVMDSIKGKWGWPKKYANTPVAVPPRSQWTTAGLTSKWSSQNTGNGIRTVYPKGSLTPSNTPLGGSSFYAEPRTFSLFAFHQTKTYSSTIS
jgi:hypothetical protein